MGRIENNLPLNDVIAKGKALGKAIRLIDQLNNTLDMERGQKIAENLRALYVYMLARLTLANVTNDAQIVAEVVSLGPKDEDRLGSDRRTSMSSGKINLDLARALALSHEMLSAAERGDLQSLASLDLERMELLKSLSQRHEAGVCGGSGFAAQIAQSTTGRLDCWSISGAARAGIWIWRRWAGGRLPPIPAIGRSAKTISKKA